MAVRNLPAEDSACYICGRLLGDHSRRERRRCERQPIPIQVESTRAARNRARRHWWHR